MAKSITTILSSSSSPTTKNHESPQVASLLAEVAKLLEASSPANALKAIVRSGLRSPWVSNAAGVCQLRMDNAQAAITLYRELVMEPNGLIVRSDIPVVFKVNFAASLLADSNVKGCIAMLREVDQGAHPAAERLWEAINRWKSGFTRFQKVNWFFGGLPAHPVAIDFPLGDLQ